MRRRAYRRLSLLPVFSILRSIGVPLVSSARPLSEPHTSGTAQAAAQMQPQDNGFDTGYTPLTYPANYAFTLGRTAAPATSFPTNSTFETGDLNGWTPSNAAVQVVNDAYNIDGPMRIKLT